MATASKTQSDADKLRAEHPNAWIAVEEGDRLEGTVRDVVRAWSDQRNRGTGDGWYPLLKVETSDGVILDFHAFMTVSYNRVMELQPIPGEEIVITYQGEGKAKEGQSAPRLFHIALPKRDPVAAANAVYARMGDGHLVTEGRQVMQGDTPAPEADPQAPLPF